MTMPVVLDALSRAAAWQVTGEFTGKVLVMARKTKRDTDLKELRRKLRRNLRCAVAQHSKNERCYRTTASAVSAARLPSYQHRHSRPPINARPGKPMQGSDCISGTPGGREFIPYPVFDLSWAAPKMPRQACRAICHTTRHARNVRAASKVNSTSLGIGPQFSTCMHAPPPLKSSTMQLIDEYC